MNECQRCVGRGKTWEGSDPTCAFTRGYFSSNNWACATMLALRDLTEDTTAVWNDDHHAGLLPIPDGEFLFMRWYKNRGRTDVAVVLDYDGVRRTLTIEEAEHILDRVAAISDDGYWLTRDEIVKEGAL